MKKCLLATIVASSFFSCSKSDNKLRIVEKNSAKREQITEYRVWSPWDPCYEKGACTDVENISIEDFENLLEDSVMKNKVTEGTRVTSHEMVNKRYAVGDKTLNCTYNFEQVSTTLKVDAGNYITNEKRSDLVVSDPACSNHSKTDATVSPLVNVQKQRKDLSYSNLLSEEIVNNLNASNRIIQKLNYKGTPAIRISVTGMDTPEGEEGVKMDGLVVISLADAFNTNTIVNHSVMKDEEGNVVLENRYFRAKKETGIDVSGMEIDFNTLVTESSPQETSEE